jgi:hypothetical protein
MARKPSVPERLRRQVQARAQGRCEYCLIHESEKEKRAAFHGFSHLCRIMGSSLVQLLSRSTKEATFDDSDT